MPTEQQGTPSPVPQENTGPTVMLQKVMESQAQVLEQSGRLSVPIQKIENFKDFGVIVNTNKDAALRLIDKNGDRINSFPGAKSWYFSWNDLVRELYPGHNYIQIVKGNSVPENKFLGSNELSPGTRAVVEANPGPQVSIAYGGSVNIKLEDASVLNIDDKYIGVVDLKSPQYLVYITQNEQGIALPPDQWKRVQSTHINPKSPVISETVQKQIDALGKHGAREYRNLGGEEYAIGTQTGIVVLDRKDNRVVFNQELVGIQRNLAVDPNTNEMYACQSDVPNKIYRIAKRGDQWSVTEARLPTSYTRINNLTLDPTGKFLIFDTGSETKILAKDTLEELGGIPNGTHARFDSQGRISVVNSDTGKLEVYAGNLDEMSTELLKRKMAHIASGLNVAEAFTDRSKSTLQQKEYENLNPIKKQVETDVNARVGALTSLTEAADLRSNLGKVRNQLAAQGLTQEQIDYVLSDVNLAVGVKERQFAGAEASHLITGLDARLAEGNFNLSSISQMRRDLNELSSKMGLVDADTQHTIRELERRVESQSTELFRTHETQITQDIDAMVTRIKTQLDQVVSINDFTAWQDTTYPGVLYELGSLAQSFPPEAVALQKRLGEARQNVQTLTREYQERFRTRYKEVREQVAERTTSHAVAVDTDIDSFVESLRIQGFTRRDLAESAIQRSGMRQLIEEQIADVARRDPDAAKALERKFKAQLSVVISDVERVGSGVVSETGQQMHQFGKELFPVWERKVKEKQQKQMDLMFIADEKSKGPGVSADNIMGDVGLIITGSDGKKEIVRLWQDKGEEEGKYQYGNRLKAVHESYVTKSEYDDIMMRYRDWSRGDQSILRGQLADRQKELRTFFSKVGERYAEYDPTRKTKPPISEMRELVEERDRLLEEYRTFYVDNRIALFKQIDRVKNAPEIEHANGKGYVPTWESHWVKDESTEDNLEAMASRLKRQLELREGILNLVGHAGTGKDVLVKMFCADVNRPYFAIDCTKWTTEYELSEDVVLESRDGASQTVKVPSVILNAISTPGAVMYFNEFNGMPEQAQIFLHSLFDEKRSLTLKTSSGKLVKADPSVLFMSSMNPDYPGTFDPQLATLSRMVDLKIGYPELHRERDSQDPNPNPPYSAAEALRVARGVDSLVDLTWDSNMQRNEFVQIWDKYVNGVENGAPAPNSVQKFDIEVILSLVQFGNRLRDMFINTVEKKLGPRDTKVSQPFTGREMRRSAYDLSKLSPEEKQTANPEAFAKKLIEENFLSHIYRQTDHEALRTAMQTWTSSKRPAR